MRLSAELLSQAEQRPNPLGERELVLRGYAIPTIEHLGATQDAYDAIDLSDNRLTTVDNFPRLKRLTSLTFTRNMVESIDAKNLKKNVPNLEHLVLTDNRITGLHSVASIGDGCPKLTFLSLVGNPVIRRQYYRLYAIHKIPTLKVLDFTKIKQSEREKAKRLSMSAAGAALESDVQLEAREAAAATSSSSAEETLTFVPGAGASATEAFSINFTLEQKAQIRDLVANANSSAEIEKIERFVKRGEFPMFALPPPPPPPESLRKRSVESEESSSKKARSTE